MHPAWKALRAHHEKVGHLHLRRLFADDPRRGERLTAEAVGVYLDYSKHRITDETLGLLLQLAEASGLRARIDAMFRGDRKSTRLNSSHGYISYAVFCLKKKRRGEEATLRTLGREWVP